MPEETVKTILICPNRCTSKFQHVTSKTEILDGFEPYNPANVAAKTTEDKTICQQCGQEAEEIECTIGLVDGLMVYMPLKPRKFVVIVNPRSHVRIFRDAEYDEARHEYTFELQQKTRVLKSTPEIPTIQVDAMDKRFDRIKGWLCPHNCGVKLVEIKTNTYNRRIVPFNAAKDGPYSTGDVDITVKCPQCGNTAIKTHALAIMLENSKNPKDPVRIIIPENTDTSHKAIATTVSGENLRICPTAKAGDDLHIQAGSMTVIMKNWAAYKKSADTESPA